MLSKCCHCLCSREANAHARVMACYPPDGRSNPLPEKVKELSNWGIHDIERIHMIQEALVDRITIDIEQENIDNVSVGMKIICELLENVRSINIDLFDTVASLIIRLIQTRDHPLLSIAQSSIDQEFNFSETISLQRPIYRIVNACLPLMEDPHVSLHALSTILGIIHHSSLDWIPVQDLFQALSHFNLPSDDDDSSLIHTSNMNMLEPSSQTELADFIDNYNPFISDGPIREIAVAMGAATSTMTLPNFTREVFSFFSSENIWTNQASMTAIMAALLAEMSDACSVLFYRTFLEKLSPDFPNLACVNILITALNLIDLFPPTKLISQVQSEILTILFAYGMSLSNIFASTYAHLTFSAKNSSNCIDLHNHPKQPSFIHNISLESAEDINVALLDSLLKLIQALIVPFTGIESTKLAIKQVWENLQSISETNDPIKIAMFLQIANSLNQGATVCLTKKMLTDMFKKLINVILNVPKSPILSESLMQFISELCKEPSFARIEFVIPFLMLFQKLVKNGNYPSPLYKHTLIMCAMHTAAADGPPGLTQYVETVINQRIQFGEVDRELAASNGFFTEQLGNELEITNTAEKEVTVFFKKKEVFEDLGRGRISGLQKVIFEMNGGKSDDESDNLEEEAEEKTQFVDNPKTDHRKNDLLIDISETGDSEIPQDYKTTVQKMMDNKNKEDVLEQIINELIFEYKSPLSNINV